MNYLPYQNKLKLFCLLFYISMLIYSTYLFFNSGYSFGDLSDIDKIREIYLSLNLNFKNDINSTLVYFCACVIFIFFSGFPLFITLLSIIIFDPLVSILVNVLSITLGTTFFYIFLKKTFHLNIDTHKHIKKKFHKLTKVLIKREFLGVFLFRFLAGSLPFLIQNIVLYSLNVKIRDYFIGTFLSLSISCSALAFFGKSLLNIILN